ncbi:MAG: HTH-type transcriptional activator CmpR [Candidatus Celerinatantimonas neptuna]|nr:MAG: HTH-type transcriptional activator CmpR [Candidatus Celerinatantimonas neptuna]
MIKTLHYIITVAESGNLNKAASMLNITSSALSKYIISKEKELGVSLFERVGKRFELTYAGKRYVNWARKIGSLQERMDEELKSIAECRSGIIHFGFQLMQSKVIISQIIPEFKKRYPNIDIILNAHSTHTIMNMLEENRLDFAIVTSSTRHDDFSYEHLTFTEVVLALPKDHPLIQTAVKKEGFNHRWVDIRLFKDEPFVALFPDQAMRQFTDTLFDAEKIKPTIDIQVPTSELALLSVSNRYGVTITLDIAIEVTEYKDSLVPLSFGEKPQYHELALIWHKNHHLQNVSQGLFDICIDHYRKH